MNRCYIISTYNGTDNELKYIKTYFFSSIKQRAKYSETRIESKRTQYSFSGCLY